MRNEVAVRYPVGILGAVEDVGDLVPAPPRVGTQGGFPEAFVVRTIATRIGWPVRVSGQYPASVFVSTYSSGSQLDELQD